MQLALKCRHTCVELFCGLNSALGCPHIFTPSVVVAAVPRCCQRCRSRCIRRISCRRQCTRKACCTNVNRVTRSSLFVAVQGVAASARSVVAGAKSLVSLAISSLLSLVF